MLATILGAVLVALVLATSASAALYRVTDIGTLGGETSSATAINERGEVTGRADTTELRFGVYPKSHAFRYSHGKMTDLDPEAQERSCIICSGGEAINDLGDIVGFGNSFGEGFAEVWKLSDLPIAQLYGSPTGINDADEVVGNFHYGSPYLLNREGRTINLIEHGPCCGQRAGDASGINEAGEVVGESFSGVGIGGLAYYAYLYSGGTLHDLGTLGGTDSFATALNNSGTIVGASATTGDTATHAFSYRKGKMTDLGTLAGATESVAYAVNDLGLIVGTSDGRAFLYFFGSMIDLNALIPPHSGWTLTTANGINVSGEIVGDGLHNGVQRGFLLTPSWGRLCPPWLWLCRTRWTP